MRVMNVQSVMSDAYDIMLDSCNTESDYEDHRLHYLDEIVGAFDDFKIETIDDLRHRLQYGDVDKVYENRLR